MMTRAIRKRGRDQRPRLDDMRMARVLRLEGLRLKVIAAKYEISRMTLYRWLNVYLTDVTRRAGSRVDLRT